MEAKDCWTDLTQMKSLLHGSDISRSKNLSDCSIRMGRNKKDALRPLSSKCDIILNCHYTYRFTHNLVAQ